MVLVGTSKTILESFFLFFSVDRVGGANVIRVACCEVDEVDEAQRPSRFQMRRNSLTHVSLTYRGHQNNKRRRPRVLCIWVFRLTRADIPGCEGDARVDRRLSEGGMRTSMRDT